MDSRFISETELQEARKKIQEDWEKVRNPETDPEIAPDMNVHDSRSLFDRLQEQKQKKDLEYEETHKMKNLIRGLDDDECQFLDLVEQKKIDADKEKELAETRDLNEYREKIALLQEQTLDNKIQLEISGTKSKPQASAQNRYSQKKLLTGVKRKSSDQQPISETLAKCPVTSTQTVIMPNEKNIVQKSALQCIGILPGLDCYQNSEDSNSSSSSDTDDGCGKTDWVGRKLSCKDAKHGSSC